MGTCDQHILAVAGIGNDHVLHLVRGKPSGNTQRYAGVCHGSCSLLASRVPHVMLMPGWLAAIAAALQVHLPQPQQQHQQQHQEQLLEAAYQQQAACQALG
jgi:hypothetical protein